MLFIWMKCVKTTENVANNHLILYGSGLDIIKVRIKSVRLYILQRADIYFIVLSETCWIVIGFWFISIEWPVLLFTVMNGQMHIAHWRLLWFFLYTQILLRKSKFIVVIWYIITFPNTKYKIMNTWNVEANGIHCPTKK